MKLTWYGHSCFLLESALGSAVFDPYSPGSVPGLTMPRLTADAVFCSHGHRDHGYSEGVRLTGKTPSFTVKSFSVFHDSVGGSARGGNIMTLIEAEGLRILHAGDLGHDLNCEQISAIGRVDVLLIPVGGHYTIDAVHADRVSRALGARLVIPMHYRGDGFGYDVIGTVDEFLKLRDDVLLLEGNVIDTGLYPGAFTLVPRCP